MVTRKPGLSEQQIFERMQEPGNQAEQRKRDAKVFLKALQERDDAVTAQMAKLRAARLAAGPADSQQPATASARPAPKPAKTAKAASARRTSSVSG
jgi:ribosomal protein L12E/L44/L45/RPP1/RPP2